MSGRALLKLAGIAPAKAPLACRFHDPDLWFAEDPDDISKAKAICLTCPFRAACLEYALTTSQMHGVWGALDAGERRQLRRRASRQGDRACPRCGRPAAGGSRYDSDKCREEARAESRALAEEIRRSRRRGRNGHRRVAVAS